MRYFLAPIGLIIALVLYASFFAALDSVTARGDQTVKPTIILVHGAFAESSSWNKVIARLNRDGYRTLAAANPLRSVDGDAAAVSALVHSIKGPVVLVGHSYGGNVITEAADHSPNVKSLVYVAAFAPDIGESALSLSAKSPGSSLSATLVSVMLPGGGKDLYIRPDKFREQFAADVARDEADLMATTQRPVMQAALAQTARAAAWKVLPTYMIYGSSDRNIPPAVEAFMAARAHARRAVMLPGASHALMVSHPAEVAAFIETAAWAH